MTPETRQSQAWHVPSARSQELQTHPLSAVEGTAAPVTQPLTLQVHSVSLAGQRCTRLGGGWADRAYGRILEVFSNCVNGVKDDRRAGRKEK